MFRMLPGTALAGDLEVSDYDIRCVIKPIRFLYDTEKFQVLTCPPSN